MNTSKGKRKTKPKDAEPKKTKREGVKKMYKVESKSGYLFGTYESRFIAAIKANEENAILYVLTGLGWFEVVKNGGRYNEQ